MLTVGSLFAGIGGFDLGFERAGFDIKWQVEIDPFCQRVLAQHWPDVPRYGDVRTIERLPRVDVVVGGFPCQDISFAGNGAGLAGERSGLWGEFDRIVGLVRPRYTVVENVAALTVRGLGRVLSDLATRGFDAEWACLPACAFGAPHTRRRVFIVAYANCLNGRPGFRDSITRAFRPLQTFDSFEDSRAGYRARMADPSALYRDADGVPNRLERNRAIGNSVHPAIAEWIAERILEAEGLTCRR